MADRRPFWYLRRRRASVAADVDEELRAHLELRVEELMAGGTPADEARRLALRQFGDLDATRAYCLRQDLGKETRVQRRLLFDDVRQDVRIALRGLWRAPVVTLTIVATVGLGIGATTAIFAAVHAAFLRPLPYRDPGRLVRIYTDAPPFTFRLSVADYLALVDQQTSFEDIGAYTDRSMTYSDGRVAELLQGRLVSSTYFRVLGLVPSLGPGFSDADGRSGQPPAVVLSHGFWQRRMGGQPDVIGRTIRLDGTDHVVRGVLPRSTGPLERGQEVFVAQPFSAPPRKGPFLYSVIARLASESHRAPAAEELRAINRRIFPVWKASYQDDKATWSLIDLQAFITGSARPVGGLALAAVALVWLIACANASNLLVARVTSRRRELAVRAALGASRARVVGHLLVESALLAAGALAVGAGVAWAGVKLIAGSGAAYFPRTPEIAWDGPVAWVMAGLAGLSVLLFGVLPALHGTGGPVDESLRALGRASTGSRAVQRLRRVLVASQFAIATPLLVVAALLGTSLNALRQVDLGFDARGVLTGAIRLPGAAYDDPAVVRTFFEELERRLATLPGVAGVTYADSRPPNGAGNFNNFDLEDRPTPPGQSQPATPWVAVTPTYFGVLGLPLIEGRLLTEADAERPDLETVVVDRAWARRFFPDASAVGKRFREGGCTACPWTEVVGVVSEVKYVGLDQPDQGTVYSPMFSPLARYVILRTHQDPAGLVSAVRQTLRELDADVPLSAVATVDELVSASLERPQSLSLLVVSFAAVAFVLSVIGIYGVMTSYVQQHLKDISIRLALGGTPTQVLRTVVGRGLIVVAGGIAVGLLLALALTRLASGLLFGVAATDVPTLAAVGTALLVSALAACVVPARRGVGVPPASILRND